MQSGLAKPPFIQNKKTACNVTHRKLFFIHLILFFVSSFFLVSFAAFEKSLDREAYS